MAQPLSAPLPGWTAVTPPPLHRVLHAKRQEWVRLENTSSVDGRQALAYSVLSGRTWHPGAVEMPGKRANRPKCLTARAVRREGATFVTQYKGKRYGASTPKARIPQRDEAGRPVSIFSKQNERNVPPAEQFRSERQYRNALARAAGYDNYDSWLHARQAAGAQQPWNIGQGLRNKSETERIAYRDEVRQQRELNRESRRAKERAYREAHREADRIKRAQEFANGVDSRGRLVGPEGIVGRHADRLRPRLQPQLKELNDFYAYDRQSLREYLQDAPHNAYASINGWKHETYGPTMEKLGLVNFEGNAEEHNRITAPYLERHILVHVAAGTMTPEEAVGLIAGIRMSPYLAHYIDEGHTPGHKGHKYEPEEITPERIRYEAVFKYLKDLWRKLTGGGFIPEDFKEYSGGIYYH